MTQETEMLLVVNYKIQCHYHRYDECVIMWTYTNMHTFLFLLPPTQSTRIKRLKLKQMMTHYVSWFIYLGFIHFINSSLPF